MQFVINQEKDEVKAHFLVRVHSNDIYFQTELQKILSLSLMSVSLGKFHFHLLLEW